MIHPCINEEVHNKGSGQETVYNPPHFAEMDCQREDHRSEEAKDWRWSFPPVD